MPQKIKLIVFDLNKTLIKEDSWQCLNLALGMPAEDDQRMLDLYNAGKLSYQKWMDEIFKWYVKKGAPNYRKICDVIHNYRYLPGAKSTVKYLRSKGYHIAIISGAMDVLVDEVAKELGIEPQLAMSNNIFVFDKNKKLKAIKTLADDPEAKLMMLSAICRRLKLDPTQVAAIGDGDNDTSLFLKTRHGITFKDSKIKKIAWKTIDQLSDLQKIF